MIGKPIALIQVPNQRLFGPAAAARYLGVDVDTLKKDTDEGRIKAYEYHGRRTYKLEELDLLIESLPEWKNGAGENPLPFLPGRKRKGA